VVVVDWYDIGCCRAGWTGRKEHERRLHLHVDRVTSARSSVRVGNTYLCLRIRKVRIFLAGGYIRTRLEMITRGRDLAGDTKNGGKLPRLRFSIDSTHLW
jgi:hypothetical protein